MFKNLKILLLFFLPNIFFGQALWDIEDNSISGDLLTDVPLQLKFKNISVDSTILLTFKIYEHDDDKFSLPVEDKMLRYGKGKYSVISNKKLKNNKFYKFEIVRDERLNESEKDAIRKYVKNTDFVADIYIPEIVRLGKEKEFSDGFLTDFSKNNFPKLLNQYVKQISPNYYLQEDINKYQLTFNDNGIQGAISTIIDQDNGDSTVINKDAVSNIVVKKILKSLPRDANLTLFTLGDLEDQIRILNSNLSDTLIEKIIINSIVINTLITTFSTDIIQRTSKNFINHFGVGSSFQSNFGFLSTVGTSYFFKPINKKVPIVLTHKYWSLARLGISAGTTFIDLAVIDKNNSNIRGVLGNNTLNLGISYIIDDGIILNTGTMLYNKVSKNPLITDRKLNAMLNVQLHIDLDIKQIFKDSFSKNNLNF